MRVINGTDMTIQVAREVMYTIDLNECGDGPYIDVKVIHEGHQMPWAYVMQCEDGKCVYDQDGNTMNVTFDHQEAIAIAQSRFATDYPYTKTTIKDIQWDTTDEDLDEFALEEIYSLPTTMVLTNMDDLDDDEISDLLTDMTGFCHRGFSIA